MWKRNTQTGILVVLGVIGNMSERSESKVRDLNDPATVQQTVGTLQTTVKLQLTFVNVLHSLIYPHKKYIQLYKRVYCIVTRATFWIAKVTLHTLQNSYYSCKWFVWIKRSDFKNRTQQKSWIPFTNFKILHIMDSRTSVQMLTFGERWRRFLADLKSVSYTHLTLPTKRIV